MSIIKMSEEEIVKIANPIWDNIVDGSNSVNYSIFSKDFSKKMLDAVPKEELERQCRDDQTNATVGNERTFLGTLRGNSCVTILWKLTSATDGNEQLGKLSLGEEEGKIKVFDAQIRKNF